MTRLTLAFAAGIAMLAGFVGTAQAQNCTPPSDATVTASELGHLVNVARSQRGVSQLSPRNELSQAAQVLACDIAATGNIGHRSSAGRNSAERVRVAGYNACLVAENLAWGYPRPSQIANGWLNSSGHNRNMLHPRARVFGVGLAQGGKGPIWVMIYATPC